MIYIIFISFLQSINKELYENQKLDKQMMYEEIYELMLWKYNHMSYEARVQYFKDDTCDCCRHEDYCEVEIPQDVGKPLKNDSAFMPGAVGCKRFEWD